MKTLNLTLNKKWFDLIASGIKKEEYREIKPYWINRFTWHEFHSETTCYESLMDAFESDAQSSYPTGVIRNDFDIVSANNGYSKDCPNVKWKHEGITIGEGNPEWGAEPGKKYFILKIGELIKENNTPNLK